MLVFYCLPQACSSFKSKDKNAIPIIKHAIILTKLALKYVQSYASFLVLLMKERKI